MFKKHLTWKQDQQTLGDSAQDAALRQLMYDRIALGNALADAEAEARRKWIFHGNGYLDYSWASCAQSYNCRRK